VVNGTDGGPDGLNVASDGQSGFLWPTWPQWKHVMTAGFTGVDGEDADVDECDGADMVPLEYEVAGRAV